MGNIKLSLLLTEQVKKRKYSDRCVYTDLAISTIPKDFYEEMPSKMGKYMTFDNPELKQYFCIGLSGVREDYGSGDNYTTPPSKITTAIRPVIKISSLSLSVLKNSYKNEDGKYELEYGEYPQEHLKSSEHKLLEQEYQQKKLKKTGKKYTFANGHAYGFIPESYDEYEYNGEKYVRKYRKSCYGEKLGLEWYKVSKIKWLIDIKMGLLISKKGLLSGIECNTSIRDDMCYVDVYPTAQNFLDDFMSKEIIPSKCQETLKVSSQEQTQPDYHLLILESIEEIQQYVSDEHLINLSPQIKQRIKDETIKSLKKCTDMLSSNNDLKTKSELITEIKKQYQENINELIESKNNHVKSL